MSANEEREWLEGLRPEDKLGVSANAIERLHLAVNLYFPHANGPSDLSRGDCDDALAAVEALLAAANKRVAFGHDKHCAWVIGGPKPPPCDCGHVELADARRRVETGQ